MAERKPQGMSFRSWVDQQIADAEKRGVFDNLPGAGKPLPRRRHGDADYGQAWLRDYARREGVAAEEFLPTPLRLRRESERLKEAVPRMRSEEEVLQTVSDLNRRILEWRKIPVGPPIFVPLMKKEEMVGRWRAAQAARTAPPRAPSASSPPPAARKRRFRLRRRRS
jgi:DnaJ-like protein